MYLQYNCEKALLRCCNLVFYAGLELFTYTPSDSRLQHIGNGLFSSNDAFTRQN